MSKAWGFTARGEGTSTLELDIYDVVGDDWLFGGVSARSVRRMLKANAEAGLIKLRINSEGGDVFDGFAIYNLLVEHKARVEVDIDALAGSIASVIAMAADEIRIASNAWMMIHNPWGSARGEPDDLRSWADVLEKMQGQAAEVYASRTGQTVQRVLELMAAETWMTAAEAKALGFVDKVTTPKKGKQPAASARAFARMHLDEYENAPAGVRELVEQSRQQLQLRESNPAAGGQGTNHNPDTGEETNAMNKKTLAKLFGISENAPDDAFEEAATAAIAQRDDARAQLARVEQLAGKTGSAVLGVLQAWKQSHEELPGAQAKLEKIESDSRTQALDSALDKAKKEKRHTPARETKMRELLDKEHVTHEGALALVATWGVVSALAAGDDDAEPEGSGSNSSSSDGEGLLRHNGKTYVEMTSAERVKLQKHNPEIFKQMRTEAKKAGLI